MNYIINRQLVRGIDPELTFVENLAALRQFARQLKMSRKNYKSTGVPHWNLSQGKVREALKFGAVPIGYGEYEHIKKMWQGWKNDHA